MKQITAIFAAALCIFASQLSAADPFNDNLNAARKAEQQKDYASTLKFITLAEASAPNDSRKADCLQMKLSVYIRQGDSAKATATADAIFATNCAMGTKRSAAFALVKYFVGGRDFASAQKTLDKLEKVPDPKNEIAADICLQRFDVCKAAGDIQGMEAGFDKIMAKKCDDNSKCRYARSLADYYRQAKMFKELAAFSERAAKVLPESFAGNMLRYQAWAYEALKDRAAEERILLAIVANEKYEWNTRKDAANRLCKAYYKSADKKAAGLDVLAKLKAPKFDADRLYIEAEYRFEQGEDAAALAIFDNALKTPNLTNLEKSQVFYAKARILKMQTRYVDAARAYQTAANLCNGSNYWALRGMVECFIKENHANEALQNMEQMSLRFAGKDTTARAKAYIELINTAISVGDFNRAKKYTAQVTALGNNLPPHILPSVQYMPFTVAFAENDLPRAEAEMDKLLAMKHNKAGEAAFLLGNRYFERAQLKKAARCFAFLPGRDWPQKWGHAQNILTAFALAGQDKVMRDFAMELAGQSRLSAKEKAACRIIGSDKFFSAKELQLSSGDYADALAKAAMLNIRFGNEQKARDLFAHRAKLFKPAKRNILNIRYVKDAPTDVGAWRKSPLLADKRNRADVTFAFGAKEAAFLVTDVMATNRKVGDASVQADKETCFYMCYDEYGIHLYFVGVDSKVKDVLANRIGGSGYEMYIALGETGPSYQWLFEQPNDAKIDIPPWNSPSKHYRHLKDYITISSRPVDGGIATAMNFSWDLAYDRLPANGDTWPFELIRWTRGGGVTWGGKFVWEIGHWGRIKFEGLTPDVLDKIRSIIIYKALARYNAQKQPRTGGKIAIWQDNEIGDPQFYDTVLKSEVERLDKLAELVTDNMNRATIEKLWVEAVPYWFDFTYHAAELRKDYLQRRFIETGK